jgi:hypothetical protein
MSEGSGTPGNDSIGELRQRRVRALGPTYRHFYRQPLHLVRGEGCWLFDVQGRRYLDCYNNVASVGHCRPEVVQALAQQAATLNTHTRYLHENTSPAVAECRAAQCTVAKRQAEWASLPVTPGFSLGAVLLKRGESLRIPAIGTLGPGTTVIDIPSIRLGNFAKLTLAGDANTGTVIVRVHGSMRLGRPSRISLADDDGAVMPRRIIWIVDGPVTLHSFATVFGTILGKSPVRIGFSSIINGAVIGNQGVTTGNHPVMLHQGFTGW